MTDRELIEKARQQAIQLGATTAALLRTQDKDLQTAIVARLGQELAALIATLTLERGHEVSMKTIAELDQALQGVESNPPASKPTYTRFWTTGGEGSAS